MARKKTTASIDAEITKAKTEMSRIQDRYDKLGEKLKRLEEQKRQYESEAIMTAYLKSGKSFEELMTFLQPS